MTTNTIIIHETPIVNRLQDLRREAIDTQVWGVNVRSETALRLIARLSTIVAEQQVKIDQLEKRLTEAGR